jgi:hypothetical protein
MPKANKEARDRGVDDGPNSKTVDSNLVVYLITWNTEECQAVDYSQLGQAYLARSKAVGHHSIIITTTRNSLTCGNRKLRPRTLASRRGGDSVLAPLRRILDRVGEQKLTCTRERWCLVVSEPQLRERQMPWGETYTSLGMVSHRDATRWLPMLGRTA